MPDLRTFRPGGSRIVAYGVSVILVVLTAIIGVALPSYVTFTPFELATLAAILITVLALLHAVGRSVVRVTGDGVEVINGYRRRFVPWADIKGFAMNEGAPWPTMVYGDDERVILFAIQRSDGPYAKEAMTYLRGWVQ
ncbi:PH domain-containing protein [Aeromicrobium sp.]|uniref:PH domain-containing protein n=1 Tax=Aeromicrobium sp. TaxID=1871063 RepID=UPI002FCA3FEF